MSRLGRVAIPPIALDRAGVDLIVRELAPEIRGAAERSRRLQAVCERLAARVAHYQWVGFYLVDPVRPDELVLGPFVGAPTEHVRIPFGRGICGRCAVEEQTIVVQDVTAEENYLACSTETRSELVVPVFVDGRMIGQLDIDSHELAPFTALDRELCETLCQLVGEHWGESHG